MTPAVLTLVFLLALWLVATAMAETFDDYWVKIVAAMKGRSLLAIEPASIPVQVRVSRRPYVNAPLRAEPRWRAAA